jgi:hypothetical protein
MDPSAFTQLGLFPIIRPKHMPGLRGGGLEKDTPNLDTTAGAHKEANLSEEVARKLSRACTIAANVLHHLRRVYNGIECHGNLGMLTKGEFFRHLQAGSGNLQLLEGFRRDFREDGFICANQNFQERLSNLLDISDMLRSHSNVCTHDGFTFSKDMPEWRGIVESLIGIGQDV